MTCPKHGEGFGEPCYMCVDEENRYLKKLLRLVRRALKQGELVGTNYGIDEVALAEVIEAALKKKR